MERAAIGSHGGVWCVNNPIWSHNLAPLLLGLYAFSVRDATGFDQTSNQNVRYGSPIDRHLTIRL